MSRMITSPLGDLPVQHIERSHWGVAMAIAVGAHLAIAAGYLAWAPEPDPLAKTEDLALAVNLGPPGGRIEPEPPPPPTTPPPETPPPEPSQLTERAADAPPVTYTAPPPPVDANARLSSGFGEGDAPAVVEAAPPPPPPAPKPVIRASILRAYQEAAAGMIHEKIVYPYKARAERIEGVATIQLSIDRSGRVMASRILQGTDNRLLDLAIADALEQVQRLDPFPSDYPSDTLTFSLKVRFLMFD
jgi:protein TonB